jgi:hypothetical protein
MVGHGERASCREMLVKTLPISASMMSSTQSIPPSKIFVERQGFP